MGEAFRATPADGGSGRGKPPVLPLLSIGAAGGFARGRRVLEVDGDGTSSTGECGRILWQGQGNLQETASPDEIIGKMRPQGIASPRSASDAAPTLAQQRVIEQGHHGLAGRQGFQHAVKRDGPEQRAVQSLALEQPIGSRPIAELLTGGAQQAGKSAAAQTGPQSGKSQCAGTLRRALLCKSPARLIEQGVPAGH